MMYRNTHGNALSKKKIKPDNMMKIFNVASQMIHKIDQRIVHTVRWWSLAYLSIYHFIRCRDWWTKDVSIISHMQASNEAPDYLAFNYGIKWHRTAILVWSHYMMVYCILPLINRPNYRIHIRNPLEDIKAELADVWRLTQYVDRVYLKPGVRMQRGWRVTWPFISGRDGGKCP